MITEFIRALFLAGVPVGALSYVLIWWGLRAEYFERTAKLKSFEKKVQQLAKARKENRKSRKDKKSTPADLESDPKYTPVHNKWLKFGGGFYGVVALLTFGLIEAGEIAGFFADFGDNMSRLFDFEIGVIIAVVIDQFMNFIRALAWPWYWMQNIDSGYFWVWFIAAYAGYWLGARAALSGWPKREQQS